MEHGQADHHEDEGHGEVDEAGQDRRHRHDEPGEVDFGDEPLLGDEAVAGLGEGVGKQLPGEQPDQHEQGIGLAVGGQVAEFAEEDGEDGHGGERLNDGPGDAEGGLFVAELDVAEGQEVEQFAVAPEFREVEGAPAAAGTDAGNFGSDDFGQTHTGRNFLRMWFE